MFRLVPDRDEPPLPSAGKKGVPLWSNVIEKMHDNEMVDNSHKLIYVGNILGIS